MICKYCNENHREDGDVNLAKSKYISMDMYHNPWGQWLITAVESDDVAVEINFCPFCGRRLNPNYKVMR